MMSRPTKGWRLVAVLMSLAMVAAACSSDGDGATVGGLEAEEVATTEAVADEEPVDDEPVDDEPAEEVATIDVGDNGEGAELMANAISSALSDPVAADGEPIRIGMINLEGSPGGSFPEIRNGAEAAIELINNSMGGINGQPLELVTCAHAIDPAAAQDCANQLAEENLAAIFVGVDFFTPGLYPIWAGTPVYNLVPIFVADFANPGVLSFSGGCVTDFVGQMNNMVDAQGHDRVAIVYSDNAPGQACFDDAQARSLTQLQTTFPELTFEGFAEDPADPADNDLVVQQALAFLEGAENPAIQFGIAAAQCAEYWNGLSDAGYEGSIYSSGACNDDNALSQAGDAAIGVTFSIQGYSERFPSLFEGNELITIEQQLRSDAIDAFEGDAPAGSFNDLGFSSIMNYWMASMEVSDPTDGQSVFDQVRSWSNHHAFASTPLDCALAPEDYQSLCSFNLAFGSWNGSTYDLESEHENWAGFLAELPPRG